jgi:DNA (cytosine-5)-methyltransferase 1
LRKPKLSVVDLFAGCGGFALGLEDRFTPIFLNELNAEARATYLVNRVDRYPWFNEELDRNTWLGRFSSADARELAHDEGAIRRMQTSVRERFGIHAGEIDLIVGGPPCQGYSGIGHRRSYHVDKRSLPSNHLYKDMAKIVGRLRPKAFVFENVRGLLSSRWSATGEKGEIWNAVKKAFVSLGEYTVASQTVYAKDYGVAQNRPRILLVGIRKGLVAPATAIDEIPDIDNTAVLKGMLPEGASGTWPHLEDLLGDLVDVTYQPGGATERYPSSPTTAVQRELRRSLEGAKVLAQGEYVTDHEYSKHSQRVQERFAAMLDGRRYKPTKKFAQRALPARWDEQGPTITATSLPDDYVHFSQPRTLTVREWARLQGFPDWYVFMGKRTTGGIRRAGNPQSGMHFRELPKYTQIGNAVPVPLARAIGEHLANILETRK